MAEIEQDQSVEQRRALVKKLNTVGWGLFFVWVGIAFLANVGWGAGLLGVGVIALGGQATRKYFGLRVEQFGVVVGGVFVLWGVWDLLKVQIGEVSIPASVLPILSVVVGLALVISALLHKRH